MDFPITKIENVEGINIKTFTSLEQLGLDNNASEADIVTAMPAFSMAIIDLPASSQSYPNFSLKRNGLLLIHKMTYNVSADMEFIHYESAKGIRRYTASYTGWVSEQPFSGWKRVGMQGALSMPSGNHTQVSVGTGDVNTTFEAPCDGWLAIRVLVSTREIAFVQNSSNGILWAFGPLFNASGTDIVCVVPMLEKHKVQIRIKNVAEVTDARFVYAQSEV